jgi:hypothetical protein
MNVTVELATLVALVVPFGKVHLLRAEWVCRSVNNVACVVL